MTPQEMLEKLKKTTNSRSHRALDAIFEVCEQQVEQGINDFSYTTIARLGEKRGVPKAQSIRNATGEPYRVLIQSFADSFGKHKIRVTSREDDWIERIQDPNTKLLVRIQEAELRSLNKKLKEILPINSVIEVNDISTADQIQKLSDLERNALEFLISTEFLEKNDLFIGKHGQYFSRKDEKNHVFLVATVDAIKKALKFLS